MLRVPHHLRGPARTCPNGDPHPAWPYHASLRLALWTVYHRCVRVLASTSPLYSPGPGPRNSSTVLAQGSLHPRLQPRTTAPPQLCRRGWHAPRVHIPRAYWFKCGTAASSSAVRDLSPTWRVDAAMPHTSACGQNPADLHRLRVCSLFRVTQHTQACRSTAYYRSRQKPDMVPQIPFTLAYGVKPYTGTTTAQVHGQLASVRPHPSSSDHIPRWIPYVHMLRYIHRCKCNAFHLLMGVLPDSNASKHVRARMRLASIPRASPLI
jgi:hypothetical protein